MSEHEWRDERPIVWVSPRRQGGNPCVGGTRIPTATVAHYVTAAGVEATLSAYPTLTRESALLACWYEGTQGRKRWRKHLGKWARANSGAMWEGGWDRVTEPPREQA